MRTPHQPRWLAYGFAVCLFCASTNLRATPISDPIINPANGHTYYLLQNSNWTDAQSQALALGGNLVTINDTGENDWVFQTFSDFGGVQRNIWIGLTSAPQPGLAEYFHWADGSTSTYRNWADGEPNYAYSEQYTELLPAGTTPLGRWNNAQNLAFNGSVAGDFYNYGVAEIVPEPSALMLGIVGVAGLLALRLTKLGR